jgi:hypothetical protein
MDFVLICISIFACAFALVLALCRITLHLYLQSDGGGQADDKRDDHGWKDA